MPLSSSLQTGVLIWIVSHLEKLFLQSDSAVQTAQAAEAEAHALTEAQKVSRHTEGEQSERRNALAKVFVTQMHERISSFRKDSNELADTASELSGSVKSTTGIAMSVVNVARQASQNVQTVASGAEELAASVREINSQVHHSAMIAQTAVTEATQTQVHVTALSQGGAKDR